VKQANTAAVEAEAASHKLVRPAPFALEQRAKSTRAKQDGDGPVIVSTQEDQDERATVSDRDN
jgi:hypothetical protein